MEKLTYHQRYLLTAYVGQTTLNYLLSVFEWILCGIVIRFVAAGWSVSLSIAFAKNFQNFDIVAESVDNTVSVFFGLMMLLRIVKLFINASNVEEGRFEKLFREIFSTFIIFLAFIIWDERIPKFGNEQEITSFVEGLVTPTLVATAAVLLISMFRKQGLKEYDESVIQKVINKSSIEVSKEEADMLSDFGNLVSRNQFNEKLVRNIESLILKEDYQDIVFINKIRQEHIISSSLGEKTGDLLSPVKLSTTRDTVIYHVALSFRFGKRLGWYLPLVDLMISYNSWGTDSIYIRQSLKPAMPVREELTEL